MVKVQEWDGETIVSPGIYSGIPLSEYHGNKRLLPGPSVSKSDAKNILPPDGSPKKFWSYWLHNPDRLIKKPTEAMIFGRATHALLLGDEKFEDSFVIRPEKVEGEKYNGNKTVWRDWFKEMAEQGLEVITKEQFEHIKRMASDASKHPFVAAGGLNGGVELSMFAKDPETGIWLRSRPDVEANDGDYGDLKTASDFNEGFLSRQIEGAGYYLQGAMTKRVCDLLGKPFRSFSFLYVRSEEYADTDFRVLSDDDIRLGEACLTYGLRKIREGLLNSSWPGNSVYGHDAHPIRMPQARRDGIIRTLEKEGIYL